MIREIKTAILTPHKYHNTVFNLIRLKTPEHNL